MVASRDATNQAITDANAKKAKRKDAYVAEVANNLFVGIGAPPPSPTRSASTAR